MSSESKSEGKSETLLDRVQNFCISHELEVDFINFAREYTDVFLDCLDDKPGSEQKVQCYAAYQEYLGRFAAKIENFIEKV